MTITEKQTFILAGIKDRGWFTSEIYVDAANELRDRGMIKLASKRTATGSTKFVWEAA